MSERRCSFRARCGAMLAVLVWTAAVGMWAAAPVAAVVPAEVFTNQLGADIDGVAAGDRSGHAVGISADGNTTIIGAPYNGGTDAGMARILTWDGTTWTQRGTDIDGEAAGDQSGHSVAISADGNTAIIGAPGNDAGGENAGQARIYGWDGTSWSQRGADIDGEAAGDQSGHSVAISADGNTAIIAAPYNDDTASNAGHARIYGWDGTTWTQRGGDIDGEAADDLSGLSVAISADGDTAIIAAPGNDAGGENAGQARMYRWDGITWTQLGAEIDGEAADNWFASVAISADGNTVAIGAPRNDGAATNAGHARIYGWDGTSWTQRGADIDGEAANDQSGHSVAISADGNTAIIGSPWNGGAGTKAGQARIYGWDGTSWTQRGADIHGEAANDQSGHSVAISADGNTAIVGAPFNDEAGADAGHARVVVSSLLLQRGLDIDGEVTGGQSGYSVAISIDGNTAIVGARLGGAGQVRVHDWDGTEWTQRGADIDGEATSDQSGFSVAISDDGNTAIIGAPFNDIGGTKSNAGHARIYDWDGTAWTQRGLDIDGEATNDKSGFSVAISADGNTAIIGARDNDVGSTKTDAGHARIYDWDGSAWTQRGLDIDGEAAYDLSGVSVAISADGNTAVIGARLADGVSKSDAGHARIYDWDDEAWIQRGLDIDGETTGDWSGWSVEISADGDTVIIGAIYNDGEATTDAGHARVYDWVGTAWTQRGLDIDGEATGDLSGFSVAIGADGNTVVVGARGNDVEGTKVDAGHARIYAWDGTAWTQRGADIDGEAAGDHLGTSVAISDDGNTAILGARFNDPAGHARVVSMMRYSTPASPTAVTATEASTTAATVGWTPGLAYEQGPVNDWTVEQRADDASTWTAATTAATPDPGGTTVTELAPGTTYRFRVAGTNANGTGPDTVSLALTTPKPPVPPPSDAPAGDAIVDRIAGLDRYGSAAQLSAVRFPDGAPIVFLATGTSFADALAAAPVTGGLGPVLLVTPTSIPASTAAELDRLRPASIVLVGGTAAISGAIVEQAQTHTGGTVTRLAGTDRYGTAASLAANLEPGIDTVYIATGTDFADALSAGPAATTEHSAILLVTPTQIPTVTATELDRLQPGRIIVLGGSAAISDDVVTQLGRHTTVDVTRLAGADRYATSAAISAATFDTPATTVYLTTGTDYPDGVTAGAATDPVLLTQPNCIPASVLAELERLTPGRITILGGPTAVSNDVADLTSC